MWCFVKCFYHRLVGGLDTLQAIENVTVDNKDKPKVLLLCDCSFVKSSLLLIEMC